jgi:hypothetical protein
MTADHFVCCLLGFGFVVSSGPIGRECVPWEFARNDSRRDHVMWQTDSRKHCILAGLVGGALGAIPSFALRYDSLVAWFIVHGPFVRPDWYSSPPLFVDALARLSIGSLVGAFSGVVQEERPRIALWIGVCVGFLVTFALVPTTQIIRE